MWRLRNKKKKKKKRRESGADAYRYLTGEAEVGGRAAFLACSGAHTAIGAAGWVLPFPPLRGCLSGRLSFGATSKEKQRPCQEHNAYRRRQGVGVCAVCSVHVYMCVGSNSRRFDCQSYMQIQKKHGQKCLKGQSTCTHAERTHAKTGYANSTEPMLCFLLRWNHTSVNIFQDMH